MMNTREKALDLLRRTRDGNDLDPSDLSLVEAAYNGRLTEDGAPNGLDAFNDLYQRVIGGTYQMEVN